MKTKWEIKKLGEICDFQNGFAFKSKLFREEGLPIVRISNIQNNCLTLDDLVFFNSKDYKEDFSKYTINKGDLVIAMSGATTGKLGINHTDTVFYLNQRVGKFSPKRDILLKKFLFYFLSTRVEENLKISAGSAQPNLSTEQIKNFRIPLPSISEQKSITEILDSLSTKTKELETLYRQKLKNLEELKKSILQKAFNGELSHFNKNEFCTTNELDAKSNTTKSLKSYRRHCEETGSLRSGRRSNPEKQQLKLD